MIIITILIVRSNQVMTMIIRIIRIRRIIKKSSICKTSYETNLYCLSDARVYQQSSKLKDSFEM